MKITADTSSDNPLILILPNMKPRATMRNRAKKEESSKSVNIGFDELGLFLGTKVMEKS